MPGPVVPTRRRRFEQWIRRSFLVRFHMGVILSVVVLSGLSSSWALLRLEVASMPLRYGVAVLIGYLVFFGCIRLWLLYVEQTTPAEGALHLDEVGSEVADEVAGETAEQGAYLVADGITASEGGEPSGGGGDGIGLDLGDGEGVLVLLILGLALALFLGVAAYLIYQAPVILGEAAAQLLLAAALRRRARQVDAPGWSGSVLRATWIPALITLCVAVGAGFALAAICPEATKIGEVFELCV